MRQCSLTAPADGWALVVADSSLAYADGAYEVQVTVDIDSVSAYAELSRWVNINSDTGGDGTDKSVALSVLKRVTAGTHSFRMLAKRYSGAGTVRAYNPTLSVIFIPAPSPIALACGAPAADMGWSLDLPTLSIVLECDLTAPQDGWAFISTSASLVPIGDAVEAHFAIDIDSPVGDPSTDRWVNLYSDAGDGDDESLAISVLKPLAAGPHTFYLLGARYTGAGTVGIRDAAMSVIYIPAASATLLTCGRLRQPHMDDDRCSVPGHAPVHARGAAGRLGLHFRRRDPRLRGRRLRGRFALGIDSLTESAGTSRFVNVYGTRATAATGRWRCRFSSRSQPATHTFYLLGKRLSGTASLRAYDRPSA